MCIWLVLLLSAVGSETRPLSPTMVRLRVMLLEGSNSNEPRLQPLTDEAGQYDPQRLSPGGPDAHHHNVKS